MLKFLVFLISFFGLFIQCSTKSKVASPESKKEVSTSTQIVKEDFSVEFPTEIIKVDKSKEEWQQELSDIEYYVLREKGTERPFTSDLLKNKEAGVYTCKACDLPLFSSDAKFKSGTGWPSFFAPIDSSYITEDTDYDIGYARTELTCTRCGGHLGHVFPDGPKPTGKRYCINGVSLDFVGK